MDDGRWVGTADDVSIICTYIRQNYEFHTRKAISRRLLATGYSADDMERAWQVIDAEPLTRLRKPWMFLVALSGSLLFQVLFVGLVLHLDSSPPPGYLSTVNGCCYPLPILAVLIGSIILLRASFPFALGLFLSVPLGLWAIFSLFYIPAFG
jgi:hypothetical protein